MTTVYLVTEVSYSDYHVLGVYSTAEKAAAAKMLYNADNDVEEMELDALPETPPGLLPWIVRIQRNGEAKATRTSPLNICIDAELRPYGYGGKSKGCTTYVWASDEAHAIKIANERRIVALAEGTWIEDFDEYLRRLKAARNRS